MDLCRLNLLDSFTAQVKYTSVLPRSSERGPPRGLGLQEVSAYFSHLHLRIGLLLHRGAGEELVRVDAVPVVELRREVHAHHVAARARHFELRRASLELPVVLRDRAGAVPT